MSVDVYLIAFNEQREYDYLADGIPDPSAWFGDATYIENIANLFALKGSVIDDALIDKLLHWPRDPGVFSDDERATVVKFMNNNIGKFLSFYAG